MRDFNVVEMVKRIEKFAEEQGKTKSEFMASCSVDASVLSKWEKGNIPSLQSVLKIADKMGVTVDTLLFGKPDTKALVNEWEQELIARRKQGKNTEEQEMLEVLKAMREKFSSNEFMWKVSKMGYRMLLVDDSVDDDMKEEFEKVTGALVGSKIQFDKMHNIKDNVDILYMIKNGNDRGYIEYKYEKVQNNSII